LVAFFDRIKIRGAKGKKRRENAHLLFALASSVPSGWVRLVLSPLGLGKEFRRGGEKSKKKSKKQKNFQIAIFNAF
jgi:hypothetical protein